MFRNLTFFLAILCAAAVTDTAAQQFGGNPPRTRWRQIDSDTARIIFPQGLDTLASRVAGWVQQLSRQNQFSLGNRLEKIDIVLQNQPVRANGYVSLGPFRSELYTAPAADNFDPSSLSWMSQLTVHEYRHVQQFNNFNNGLSRVMKKLFGQEGYALAINAAVPNWFFEGDAVYHETLLTPHGRGTLPYFLKAYPSLWQAGKHYSWMKLRNGSLKDYVPNHYDLGYLLVNYGSQRYGYEFWRKVTRDASAYQGLFYPLQRAVKKHAGIDYKTFRNNAFDYYKDRFQLKDSAPPLPDTHRLEVPASQTVTNYQFPVEVAPDQLLYLKTSYDQRPAFYLKSGTGEKRIRYRDISIEDQFSYRNGKIVYAAYETHPRWRWKSYHVVKILDIATGTQRTLTHGTRYFSPDISADGRRVVANEILLNGDSRLVLLDAQDGDLQKAIMHDSVRYFANPKILNDSTVVCILRFNNTQTCIGTVDLVTGTIQEITPPSNTVIGTIDPSGDRIYFTASQHLKDEIFYYDRVTRQLYRLPTPGVGSYFVNNGATQTSWSSFTADGYRLSQISNASAPWQPVPMDSFIRSQTGIVSDTLHRSHELARTPLTHDSSHPYPQWVHPIGFHSWRPNYTDPEFSFTLYGNNILNTTETQLYYAYNENDKTHTAGGAITYGGLFPFITLGSAYTFDRRGQLGDKIKSWNEWNSYIGLSIPLGLTSNRTYKSFRVGSQYHYRADFNKGATQMDFTTLRFSYLAHGLSWSQQIQSAVQDIYPRLGYSLDLQFRHALNLYKSNQSYGALNLYLPGLLPAQHLVLSSALQYSGSDQRIFGNRMAYARGFAARDAAGVYTGRANYHFTLFYPDWGLANIFYLSRVRANLFYDLTRAYNRKGRNPSTVQSTGAEVYFDTKWWNQHPLTFGLRLGHLLTPLPQHRQSLFFEFVLPGNLVPR